MSEPQPDPPGETSPASSGFHPPHSATPGGSSSPQPPSEQAPASPGEVVDEFVSPTYGQAPPPSSYDGQNPSSSYDLPGSTGSTTSTLDPGLSSESAPNLGAATSTVSPPEQGLGDGPQGAMPMMEITALILAVGGALLAVLPYVYILGWLLVIIAGVLAIVALTRPQGRRAIAVTALVVAMIGVIAGTIAFLATLGRQFDAKLGVGPSTDESSASQPDQRRGKPDQTEKEPEQAEDRTDQNTTSKTASSGETVKKWNEGSRESPLEWGTTIEYNDWLITITEFEPDASYRVDKDKDYSDILEHGSLAVARAEVTYTGTDIGYPIEIEFAYVTEQGNTFRAATSFQYGVDLDNMFYEIGELYPGATGEGAMMFSLPEDAEGLLRIRIGLEREYDTFLALE